MTDAEKQILQDLIDISYQQFVQTVAEARNIAIETVRSFADGRIFTGQQALDLGVVDRLGTEEDARQWVCKLVDLDPEKTESCTLEKPKSLLNRVLGNNQVSSKLSAAQSWVEFEVSTGG